MKKKIKAVSALAAVLVCMLMLTACTAVQVSSNLIINSDGSGSREIKGYIAKQDHQDGYGSAYYYFKKHGADLEAHIKGIYSEMAIGSEEWLSVQVDDSGSEWEIVTLSFEFTSFDDYVLKLTALCYDEAIASSFIVPDFEQDGDGTVTYTESTAVMTAIYKTLQASVMADESIYDPASTKDGVALNDGSADGQLEDYGVELMKPENGDAMTIMLNGAEPAALEAMDGFFTYTSGTKTAEKTETSCVLNYTFDDTLSNFGTAGDNDLNFGKGSTGNAPVYTDGLAGKAIKLDGATYLASPNKTYNFEEMTISFYYRMDEYTKTDTGANMIIVPAGLGALGSGVIDLEFIKEDGTEGIQLLAKMNSTDWQTQDKLYSEGYFMEVHLSEWHNYTIVFKNEYDEHGSINDSFVYMYIDGRLAQRSKLSVAAGLTYSLGSYDDGSFGEANGGFNIGGYYENDTIKRACTGLLDNFMVFDGALSEEEINTLIYTVKVDNEYNPDTVDVVSNTAEDAKPQNTPTAAPKSDETKQESTDNKSDDGTNTLLIVGIAAAVILAAGIVIMILRRNKSK